MNRLLLGSAAEIFHMNEKGFYEPGISFNVDLQRLDRVASRIVKGLYWKEYGERLPDEYRASAFNDSGIRLMDENQLGIFRSVLEVGSKTVGRKVFRYWHRAVPEDKNTTAWILLFYESVYFFGFTTSKLAESKRTSVRKVN